MAWRQAVRVQAEKSNAYARKSRKVTIRSRCPKVPARRAGPRNPVPTVRTPRIIHVTATNASGASHPATPQPRSQPLPPPVYRTPKPKQFGWVATLIAVVGAFAVGAAVVRLGSRDTTTTPAATASVTQTAPNGEPNEEPTEEPTAAGFTPRKSDSVIGIKILEQKCLGCAGCSVTYPIKPKYVGTQELN